MTKADLIIAVQAAMGGDIKKSEVTAVVEAMLRVITGTLEFGEAVHLTGLGKFEVRETKPRKGRNPHTGEAIDIPAGRRVAFSAAKALKDAVN